MPDENSSRNGSENTVSRRGSGEAHAEFRRESVVAPACQRWDKPEDGFRFTALGQVGYIIETPKTRIVVDPYLSNSVAETFGQELNRLVPAPLSPESMPQLDWLLLTHAHMDHTDAATIGPLLRAQPKIRSMCPYESRAILADLGRRDSSAPPVDWFSIGPDFDVRAIPAAHTLLEHGDNGEWRYCGYLMRSGSTTVYHAGDTVPHPAVFDALRGEKIDLAFLPVNERNYYRDTKGIVGNMSVREAFLMAADLGVDTLIPTHWDLFAPNSVFPQEIELLHALLNPPFSLRIIPSGETMTII